MTKEEIKAMIAQKIEGQGTNLDAASVLPTILNWLVDNTGVLEGMIVDLGENERVWFKIDAESFEKIRSQALLLRLNGNYFTRTSDYLINKSDISNFLDGISDVSFIPQTVYAIFGFCSWHYDETGIEVADLLALIDYMDSQDNIHYAIVRLQI